MTDFRQKFTENAEQFDAIMVEMLDENKRLEDVVQRLRGQLQNVTGHLEGVDRRYARSDHSKVIEAANKALYETLHD